MIKKYNLYKESLLNKLNGPTEEEAWNNLAKEYIGLDTPPDTVEQFLDYIFENGEVLNDKPMSFNHKYIAGSYRWRFNNRAAFFYMEQIHFLYVYHIVYKILESFYGIKKDKDLVSLIKDRLEEKWGINIYIKQLMVLDD